MSKSKKVLEMIEGEYQQWFKGEKHPGANGGQDYPKLVHAGLSRMRPGGDKDMNWVWFHMASQGDREEFEKYLVDTKDPLASAVGSAEWRFKAFMTRLGVEL